MTHKSNTKIHSFPLQSKSKYYNRELSLDQRIRCQLDDARVLRQYDPFRQHFITEDIKAKDFSLETEGQKTEQKFNALAKNWFEETAHLSLVRQQTSHMSFLKIIGMGRKALPFIFREFEKVPMISWLVALEAIIGDDVASEAKTHKDAVHVWLEWGRKNNFR